MRREIVGRETNTRQGRLAVVGCAHEIGANACIKGDVVFVITALNDRFSGKINRDMLNRVTIIEVG